ncbi:hypothetical protein AAVH_07722 [Aphelenchoides avenae]|nr:hypothetical protein AAVH_07722 [Aphelenchus avenae]
MPRMHFPQFRLEPSSESSELDVPGPNRTRLGDPCTLPHLLVRNHDGVCFIATDFNILLNIRSVREYIQSGQASTCEMNTVLANVFARALAGADPKRDCCAAGVDIVPMLYPIGFADRTEFGALNSLNCLDCYILPQLDHQLRRLFKTSCTRTVTCQPCGLCFVGSCKYALSAITGNTDTTIAAVLGQFRAASDQLHVRKFEIDCPQCQRPAAGRNTFVHVPHYLIVTTKNDMPHRRDYRVDFMDRFKAFGHEWQYVNAARTFPARGDMRGHAAAVLYDRQSNLHFEINNSQSRVTGAPANLNEYRFVVYECLSKRS